MAQNTAIDILKFLNEGVPKDQVLTSGQFLEVWRDLPDEEREAWRAENLSA